MFLARCFSRVDPRRAVRSSRSGSSLGGVERSNTRTAVRGSRISVWTPGADTWSPRDPTSHARRADTELPMLFQIRNVEYRRKRRSHADFQSTGLGAAKTQSMNGPVPPAVAEHNLGERSIPCSGRGLMTSHGMHTLPGFRRRAGEGSDGMRRSADRFPGPTWRVAYRGRSRHASAGAGRGRADRRPASLAPHCKVELLGTSSSSPTSAPQRDVREYHRVPQGDARYRRLVLQRADARRSRIVDADAPVFCQAHREHRADRTSTTRRRSTRLSWQAEAARLAAGGPPTSLNGPRSPRARSARNTPRGGIPARAGDPAAVRHPRPAVAIPITRLSTFPPIRSAPPRGLRDHRSSGRRQQGTVGSLAARL